MKCTAKEIKRDWLSLPVGYFGECDRCHCDDGLWIDPNTLDEGRFLYCMDCWETILKKMEKRNHA